MFMEKDGRKHTKRKQWLLLCSLHSGSITVFVPQRLEYDPKAQRHLLMTQGTQLGAEEGQTTCPKDPALGTVPLTDRLRGWWQVCRLECSRQSMKAGKHVVAGEKPQMQDWAVHEYETARPTGAGQVHRRAFLVMLQVQQEGHMHEVRSRGGQL